MEHIMTQQYSLVVCVVLPYFALEVSVIILTFGDGYFLSFIFVFQQQSHRFYTVNVYFDLILNIMVFNEKWMKKKTLKMPKNPKTRP